MSRHSFRVSREFKLLVGGDKTISNLKTIDLDFIDDLVGYPKGAGWVLQFSDRSFAEFFKDTVNVNIDDQRWIENGGTSKGKRLRCFLRKAKDTYVIQILEALWEMREYELSKANEEDPIPKSDQRLEKLLSRLSGQKPAKKEEAVTTNSTWNAEVAKSYFDELMMLTSLAPHPRGFAFEKFLNRLFVDCGLSPRKPFRITGQQLDGSFELNGDTYLLEAKWENAPQGNSPLYAFEGKVTGKAAWSRGLFISYSGFSPDGLEAFGNQKRTILLDGLDLSETLSSGRNIADVIALKARRAAETGKPYIRVADL